jgi:hypothetical protein
MQISRNRLEKEKNKINEFNSIPGSIGAVENGFSDLTAGGPLTKPAKMHIPCCFSETLSRRRTTCRVRKKISLG